MLLARQGILSVYYTSPVVFTQRMGLESNIKKITDKSLPECDNSGYTSSTWLRQWQDRFFVSYILNSPAQHFVNVATRRFREVQTIQGAEGFRKDLVADLCHAGQRNFCASRRLEQETVEGCQLVGGDKRDSTSFLDPATERFLALLDESDLDGVIIWGLQRPRNDHTHAFVHSAIHKSLLAALRFSSRVRHICYIQESPSVHIGKLVYQEPSRGRLAKSLVFGSPKHMTWTNDPGFLMLPIEPTSRYIFHGETPRPHSILKKLGFAVEWETWGPGRSHVLTCLHSSHTFLGRR